MNTSPGHILLGLPYNKLDLQIVYTFTYIYIYTLYLKDFLFLYLGLCVISQYNLLEITRILPP